MTASEQPATDSIYQMKVTLERTEPPIWRRFQTGGRTTLHHLHQVLQVVMGWENAHLYQFTIGETHYGEPQPDYGFDRLDTKDATRFELYQVVHGETTSFTYEYDFGDGWEHEVLIETVLPTEPGVSYPICIEGERACPPEDCGGVWAYAALLETIQNPQDEEYEGMMDWLGGDFDPEAFDMERVNRILSPAP